jgi:hypothetical protein
MLDRLQSIIARSLIYVPIINSLLLIKIQRSAGID